MSKTFVYDVIKSSFLKISAYNL